MTKSMPISKFAVYTMIRNYQIRSKCLGKHQKSKKPNIRSKRVDYTTDVNNFLSHI